MFEPFGQGGGGGFESVSVRYDIDRCNENELRDDYLNRRTHRVTYEIRGTSADGERIRLNIAEDGTVLENGGRNTFSG